MSGQNDRIPGSLPEGRRSLFLDFNELAGPPARLTLGMRVALITRRKKAEEETMDTRRKLEQELKKAVARLRQLEGSVEVDEVPGVPGDNTPFADEVDEIQANERREIGFATRELLVERVNRLVAALDRLGEGEYGRCSECGEEIAQARLRVMPEVSTCVRCQDRIERYGRQLEAVGSAGDAEED